MNEQWKEELRAAAKPEKIDVLSRFFKTGPGEYGEGDRFIGLTVPDNRALSRQHRDASLEEISAMLHEEIHEFRLAGLLALVAKFSKERDNNRRREIVDFYLAHAERINNWDLVDLSAPQILGAWLLDNHSPTLLDRLGNDGCLWRQRIAIVATYTLIKANRLDDTFRLAERYLTHPHPLIHKATGWMLREAGKRDLDRLRAFLDTHADKMPRTALRYAIEKMDADERKHIMNKS